LKGLGYFYLSPLTKQRLYNVMKVSELNLTIGQKIKLYVKVASDGSGRAMGRGIDGIESNLVEVTWNGGIYDGTMGSAILLDGTHIGMPISAKDVISANPELKPKNLN
jgi:hypothetical protein